MKSLDFLKEGFVEDAHDMHIDHEVQMAREECYHAAENAIQLHKLLRNVSEQQGLEGWVSAKITLANDYLNTVREYLEYELMSAGEEEGGEVVVTSEIPADEMQIAESELNETSAGSVAGVVNPPAKNKSKVGTLFGGTYKQKKSKA